MYYSWKGVAKITAVYIRGGLYYFVITAACTRVRLIFESGHYVRFDGRFICDQFRDLCCDFFGKIDFCASMINQKSWKMSDLEAFWVVFRIFWGRGSTSRNFFSRKWPVRADTTFMYKGPTSYLTPYMSFGEPPTCAIWWQPKTSILVQGVIFDHQYRVDIIVLLWWNFGRRRKISWPLFHVFTTYL